MYARLDLQPYSYEIKLACAYINKEWSEEFSTVDILANVMGRCSLH